MPKRRQTPDRPRDLNQLAKRVVDLSTGDVEESVPDVVDPKRAKRGHIRAEKTPSYRRTQIARDAAHARWAKPKKKGRDADK